jgi:predicted nuclease of predicted toxin-antitoxin system
LHEIHEVAVYRRLAKQVLNISPLTVEALTVSGLNVIRVPDELPPTASDAAILEYARRQERVVVTQDLDFSNLLALGGHDRPSLITDRVSDAAPRTVSNRLLSVLPHVQTDLRSGAAVTINDERVRVRTLPIS